MNYKDTPGPTTYTMKQERIAASYSFGTKVDPMEMKNSELVKRRQIVDKEIHQPEFVSLRSFIGTAPGAKINPPDSTEKVNRSMNAGPASYLPKLENLTQGWTIRGRPTKKAAATIAPGPGKYDLAVPMNYL